MNAPQPLFRTACVRVLGAQGGFLQFISNKEMTPTMVAMRRANSKSIRNEDKKDNGAAA
jgi:hypothetical protein